MTPPDSSSGFPSPSTPAVPPPALSCALLLAAPQRVRTPGELVAAIPALMGFHPRGSLVLLALGGGSGTRVGLTLRIDLPPPQPAAPGHTAELGDTAVRGLLLDDPAAAVVVVVAPGGGDPPYAGLVEHVRAGLERHDVAVGAALWAQDTTAGSRWRCYDRCGCAGVVPDPGASPVLAAAVAAGQVVHADRAALERLVAPVAADRLRRREELLVRTVEERLDAPVPELPEPGLAPVTAALAAAAAGRLELDDDRVVELALALSAPAVRDAALLRCAGPEGAAAEQLWAALARETPDPEAAEPAALLAVSALLRGDGALANVALDRAEQAWPGHALTGLLRVAAQSGVRPAQLRAWLDDCPGAPG